MGTMTLVAMQRPNGSVGYTLQLITYRDSPIKQVSDLEGKRVARVPPRAQHHREQGKLVAEAIEAADRGQIEAIQAGGARTAQVYLIAVPPKVMPVRIGATVYRCDINVRESACWASSAPAASGCSSMPRSTRSPGGRCWSC